MIVWIQVTQMESANGKHLLIEFKLSRLSREVTGSLAKYSVRNAHV